MSSICPSCTHANRDGARFCDQCGTPLAVSAPAGAGARAVELRQGTFLFCDLVQSTRLANQLDPEDLRSVFKCFQTIVATTARRHAGRVIRFVGDGAFVSFGAAEANEDAALQAIETALDLVRELPAVQPVPTVTLQARVGIATGTVLMGERVDEAAIPEEAVIGPVAHLAARLMTEAPIGGIVIADATRRLAGGFFKYEDLGALALKGFDQAVRAWRVLSASRVASRFEAQRAPQSVAELVGRAAPLAQLLDRWQQARTGHGQAVMLVGDAGIGKSRLARALRDQALQDGAAVLEIHNAPGASNTPLFAVGALLRRLVRLSNAEDAARRELRVREWLGQLLPAARIDEALNYLAPLFSPAAPTLPESADRVRELTIELLVEMVQAYAAKAPLFMLCEDLHWADATTALLLARLAAGAAQLPVLMLLTTRADADQLSALEQASAARVELTALDEPAARTLVQLVAGEHALPAAVADAIVRRGEGNALYLEEITRAYLDAAAVQDPAAPDPISPTTAGGGVTDTSAAAAWTAGAGATDTPHARAAAALPSTLRALVQSRLDRWPHLKPVAQAAAVLGREFSAPLLQELLDGRPDLPTALHSLAEHQLLERTIDDAAGLFRFKHALVQEAVYQTLLRSDRQRLHARAADALIRYFAGEPDLAPDVLAHHLAQARRFEEAVSCLAQAGAATAARAAYLESIGHCRSGLQLTEQIEASIPRRRLQRALLTQLAVALAATSGYAAPAVEDAYQQARALCDGDDDPSALFPIVGGLGTFYFVRAQIGTADELAHQCLALATQAQRPDLLIEAYCFCGYTRVYLGRITEGRAALEQCIALYHLHEGKHFTYRSAQDPSVAAGSLLAIAAWLQGDCAQAESSLQQALAHARQLARPFDLGYAHAWFAMLRNLQRRYDTAAQHAETAREICARGGFNTWLVAATLEGGIAAGARTPAPEVVTLLQQALGGYLQAGAEVNAPFYLWGLASAQHRLGWLDGARQTIAQALARSDASGETFLRAELLTLAAQLAEEPERARSLLRQALQLADAQGATVLALRSALLLLAQGDPANLPTASLCEVWSLLESGRELAPERIGAALTEARHRLDQPQTAGAGVS
jgi:class 3 adenylate cyclase